MALFRLPRKGRASILGPLEARVMDVIWRSREPLTVNDVHAGLGQRSQHLAYSTVKAVLANLVVKGHLRRDSERRSHTFSAVESREAFQQRTVASIIDSLMKDYRQPLMAHLAGQFAADEASLAEIERLIEKKKAERRR
jgi:predicted transcriptional regulator